MTFKQLLSIDTPEEHHSRVSKWLAFFALLSSIVVLSFSWNFYQEDKNVVIHSVGADSPTRLEAIMSDLTRQIDYVVEDTLAIADIHHSHLSSLSNEEAYIATKKLIKNVFGYKTRYDQIRLLDVTGQERIRFNLYKDKWVSVPDYQLQNKAHRYYFTEGKRLLENQVYISQIDLNMEKGAVEVPFKPVVRFVTPVIKDNELVAVVIINYHAQELIDVLNKYSNDRFQLMLLNHKGYWLKSPNEKDEWGFMFWEKQAVRFDNRYPEAWREIEGNDGGQVNVEEGVFHFETVHLANIQSNLLSAFNRYSETGLPRFHTWKIISYMPKDTLNEILFSIRARYIAMDLLILLLILVSSMSFFYAYKHYHSHKISLTKHAYYDELTGALNRRAMIQYGGDLIANHQAFSLIYFDLDKFKPLNDSHGHEFGDYVLKTVVKDVHALLRQDDLLFRIGGDEFAVFLMGQTSDETLKRITNRIDEKLKKTKQYNHQKFSIVVSMGMAHYNGEDTNLDQLLNASDKEMYQHKKMRQEEPGSTTEV